MNMSEVLSVVAIGISLASLGWQIRTWSADRTKTSTRSRFYSGDEDREPGLLVAIAVDGPRPIVVRWLCMKREDGTWSGTSVGEGKGIRLSNGDHYEETLRGNDLYSQDWETHEYLAAVDFYFEDSLGRKHFIKDCRENLQKLRLAEKQRREKAIADLASI